MATPATGKIAQNAKGRALRPARPLISDHARGRNHNSSSRSAEKASPSAIVIREVDPGAFTVEIVGEGLREFPTHRAARGFAAGRRLVSGVAIVDLTEARHG